MRRVGKRGARAPDAPSRELHGRARGTQGSEPRAQRAELRNRTRGVGEFEATCLDAAHITVTLDAPHGQVVSPRRAGA